MRDLLIEFSGICYFVHKAMVFEFELHQNCSQCMNHETPKGYDFGLSAVHPGLRTIVS